MTKRERERLLRAADVLRSPCLFTANWMAGVHWELWWWALLRGDVDGSPSHAADVAESLAYEWTDGP